MGIILICIGIAILAVGIVMLSKGKDKDAVSTEETFASTGKTQPADKAPVPTNVDVRNDAKQIGDNFEDFIADFLADWRFTLLDRTQDKMSSAGVVAESSKNPDLHIQQKRGESNIEYYLECKYRNNWKDGKVELDSWHIERYRKFQGENRRKVLIALGVGGTPGNPETVRIIPGDSIPNGVIRKIDTHYTIQPTSEALYQYIDNYFTEVFEVAKQRKQQK